jgi:8-oxo-dGTP diphosphatase
VIVHDALVAGDEVRWRRAAVYMVCRDEQQRLLLTRCRLPGLPDDGKWTLPGGGMEWGESAAETAHRELAEETGLSASMGSVLGVFSRWYTAEESFRGEAGHALGIVAEATGLTGALRTEVVEDGTTTDRAAWFTLEEVRSLDRVELVDFVLTLV